MFTKMKLLGPTLQRLAGSEKNTHEVFGVHKKFFDISPSKNKIKSEYARLHLGPPFVCAPGRVEVAVIKHRREHGRLKAGGGAEATAYDKRLDGAAAAAARLGDRDALEQQPQLAVQQPGVPAAKYLRHEGSPGGQNVRRDVECRQEQLQFLPMRHVGTEHGTARARVLSHQQALKAR